MYLISITLRDYRIHREVRLDLDRARTLIGGPNESGKSTIVEAMHRVLFLKHRTTGARLEEMRSAIHGGIPEVEVVFHTQGQTYSLKKRFRGTSGSATLTQQHGPSWQNEDAETKLGELLGEESVGGTSQLTQKWAHLWVWQGNAPEDPLEDAKSQHQALLAQLQVDGGAAAVRSPLDAKIVDQLSEKVRSMLNQNGSPKANSDLARKLQEEQTALAQHQTAAAKISSLEAAIEELELATATLASTSESLKAIKHELALLSQRREQVDLLRSQAQQQQLQLDQARASLQLVRENDRHIASITAEIQQLQRDLRPKQEAAEQLQQRRDASQAQLKQADVQRSEAYDKTRSLRQTRELATAFVAWFKAASNRDFLEKQLEKIAGLRVQLADASHELATLPPFCSEAKTRLNDLLQQQTTANTILQQMATGIEVIAADSAVTVDSSRLEPGNLRIITAETEVMIGRHTRLRITPGGGKSLQETQAEARRAQQELDQFLQSFGLASPELALQIHEQRLKREEAMRTIEAELKGLQASRIDEQFREAEFEFRTARTKIDTINGSAPLVNSPEDLAAATKLSDEAIQQLLEAEQAEFTAQSNWTSIHDSFETLVQQCDRALLESRQAENDRNEKNAQLQLLTDTHGDQRARQIAIEKAQHEVNTAHSAHAETLRLIEALEPENLDQDFKRLQRAAEENRDTHDDFMKRQAGAQRQLELEGTVDPHAELENASARLDLARNRRIAAKKHCDAIRLLHGCFTAVRQELSDKYSRPLAEKIASYLRFVLGPTTQVELTHSAEGFQALQIIRPDLGSGALSFAQLSIGTREQMAAAVRLAIAELLAENFQGSLPVVFDDAFTYSDPTRVKNLQRMLDHAADRGLQIIVLSCNPTDYALLGAKTIHLP